MDRILRKTFYILLYIAIIVSILYIIKYYIDMAETKSQSNLLNEIHVDYTSPSPSQSDESLEPQKTERTYDYSNNFLSNPDSIDIYIRDILIIYPAYSPYSLFFP